MTFASTNEESVAHLNQFQEDLMYYYFVNKSEEIEEKYLQSKKRLYEKYVDTIFGTIATLSKELFT